MSYDISLRHPQTSDVLQIEHHTLRGGTYQVGGTTKAWLNVTYNYCPYFVAVLGPDGIRTIYGMSGAQSIPVLERAIGRLGDDVADDYWEPTEGNAKAALKDLLTLAKAAPHGIWGGD